MIRILHIIPNLRRGGAERLVLDICTELSKRPDVEVRLVCFSDQNEYPEYLDSVKPIVINSSINLSLFRRNNLHVEELQEFVNDFKPDVIHTHLFESEIISRSINYPSAKWFTHCHDNMVQFSNIGPATLLSKQALTNYYEKTVLFSKYKQNEGTHFIAISKDTEAYLKKTAKPYPVTFLPNAINYQKFSNPSLKIKPGNVLRLINIGSFVENKNQTFLLEVATVLKKRNIQFELHFLGDGEKRVEFETRARNLGLEKEVVFHGMVDQVEEILWQSDLYVHSALVESFGLVFLEAMAAGLPVITLDGKGNRDLIVHGKNGFMLIEQDAAKFAVKILDVWGNQQLYTEMSIFAKDFSKGYNIEEYIESLLEIYKQSL